MSLLARLRPFSTGLFKFNKLATSQLQEIHDRLEHVDEIDTLEFDGAVLSVQFSDSKFILMNKHEASRKIWYSSFTGVDYFHYQNAQWVSATSGLCIRTLVANDVYKAAGVRLKLE